MISVYEFWEYCTWGISNGVSSMSMSVGHVHDVKSSKFMDASMFPVSKENVDNLFQNYFSKHNADDCFIDLHGELQRIDLRS